MANKSIEKFIRRVKEKNLIVDMDNKIGPSGDFNSLYDIEVLLTRFIKYISIPKGTYPFNPNVGNAIHLYIHEPQDDITRDAIIESINEALVKMNIPKSIVNFSINFYSNTPGFLIIFNIIKDDDHKKINVSFDLSLFDTMAN